MAIGNNVNVTGNLTSEPELRETGNGTKVASFSLAHNRRWQNRQTQEWEEATSFIDVVVWGELAENVVSSVSKGDRLTVEGRLDQRSWEDKETGAKRSKLEITADEVSASLRYATVKITKVEKDSEGSKGSGRKSSAPKYDNEEPF